MFAARVDQHRDGAAVDDVEAATLQRKSFVYKIVDGRSEVQLAVKPRLYSVLVGRLHVFEMAGLKGTQMRIDDGGGQRGLPAAAAQDRKQAPAEEDGEEKCGSYGQPAPGRRISHRHNGVASGSAKLRLQFLAQCDWSALVQASALERGPQIFVGLQRGDTVGAGNQVALEIGGARGVQFAVEITMENGLGELTIHGRPPVCAAQRTG